MTEKEIFLLGLKALGKVQEDGLKGQIDAINALQDLLTSKHRDLANKYRVEEAHRNASERLPQHHESWAVHMTHCYGLDYDDCYGDEEPTSRFACKYGEDDICPAALHEDPWTAYRKLTKTG
jgi:hypothetical protein